MAAVLLLAWLVVVLLLLVDGQLAPLALVAAVPAAICGWLLIGSRPVTTGGWIVRAIGVLAGLVTVGLAILLAEPLVDGRSLIHPSAEMNYAALLALALTVAYSARHLSPEPGRAVAVFGVAVPALVGGAILISADRPAGVPDECLVPLVARAAEVTVTARSEIDGEVLGEATLSGARHADDEHWAVELSGQASPGQTVEMIVSDGRTWLRHDGADWQPVAGSAATAGGWLDGRLTLAISHRPLPAMEDLGLEALHGVTTRRCRIYIDGVSAATAVPPLAWLAGAEPLATRTRLDIWRGELDWWLGRDGRLEHATIIIGGLPADAWRMRGMRGLLMAEMWVSEPSTPPVIEEPVP